MPVCEAGRRHVISRGHISAGKNSRLCHTDGQTHTHTHTHTEADLSKQAGDIEQDVHRVSQVRTQEYLFFSQLDVGFLLREQKSNTVDSDEWHRKHFYDSSKQMSSYYSEEVVSLTWHEWWLMGSRVPPQLSLSLFIDLHFNLLTFKTSVWHANM